MTTSDSPVKQRLLAVYWFIVGLVGLGQPIVDRRSMFGNDPRNDPYNLWLDAKARD